MPPRLSGWENPLVEDAICRECAIDEACTRQKARNRITTSVTHGLAEMQASQLNQQAAEASQPRPVGPLRCPV